MVLSMVYPPAEQSVHTKADCSAAKKEHYWAREMVVETDRLSVDSWDQLEDDS
jgi:hypothetical protein